MRICSQRLPRFLALVAALAFIGVSGCSSHSTPAPGSIGLNTPVATVVVATQPTETAMFSGAINGIQLGLAAGPTPVCARSVEAPDWHVATAATPFDIGLDRLPQGVMLRGTPRVGQCSEDGRIMWVVAQLETANGGVVQVSRWESVRWYSQQFPADGVAAGSVASRPAVFAEAGRERGTQTAVIVRDDEIHGSTMLLSSNVSLADLRALAEQFYR